MSAIDKATELLARLQNLEQDVAERARLAEVERIRHERARKTAWLTGIAPVFIAVYARFLELASRKEEVLIAAANELLDTLYGFFYEAAEAIEGDHGIISAEEVVRFCFNFSFVKKFFPVHGVLSAREVIKKAQRFVLIFSITRAEYTKRQRRIEQIIAAIKARKDGKPYDQAVANERQVALLELCYREYAEYFLAEESFAQFLVHRIKEHLQMIFAARVAYSSQKSQLEASATTGLKEMLFEGVSGVAVIAGSYSEQGQPGQEYAIALSFDGAELKVLEVFKSNESAVDYLSGYKGATQACKTGQNPFSKMPHHLKRFLNFQLAKVGGTKQNSTKSVSNGDGHHTNGGGVLPYNGNHDSKLKLDRGERRDRGAKVDRQCHAEQEAQE